MYVKTSLDFGCFMSIVATRTYSLIPYFGKKNKINKFKILWVQMLIKRYSQSTSTVARLAMFCAFFIHFSHGFQIFILYSIGHFFFVFFSWYQDEGKKYIYYGHWSRVITTYWLPLINTHTKYIWTSCFYCSVPCNAVELT